MSSEVFTTLTRVETLEIYSLLSIFPESDLPPTLKALRERFGALGLQNDLLVSPLHGLLRPGQRDLIAGQL